MPKAERRRWVELHLSRDRDTPASLLLKAKTRNKKRTKHPKFVSSEDDNWLVPISTCGHLLKEDQPLHEPHQSPYLDDNDSHQGSADWDWAESVADGVDEASSTTLLFGAGQWTSTWPSKTVMEIMDELDFQLEGPDPATENTDIDQVHGSLSTDGKPVKLTTPKEPRNILPEHEKLAKPS